MWLPASKPFEHIEEHCLCLFPCPEHSEDSTVPQIDHTKHTFRTAHTVSGPWGGNSQTGRWKPNHVYMMSRSHTLNSPVPSIHSGWLIEGREGGRKAGDGKGASDPQGKGTGEIRPRERPFICRFSHLLISANA